MIGNHHTLNDTPRGDDCRILLYRIVRRSSIKKTLKESFVRRYPNRKFPSTEQSVIMEFQIPIG